MTTTATTTTTTTAAAVAAAFVATAAVAVFTHNRHHRRRRHLSEEARNAAKAATFKLEVCCDVISSVHTAISCGAHRVELCANLVDGGTTPSPGLIRAAVQAATAEASSSSSSDERECASISRRRCGINVLIRPRGGDFVYSPAEMCVMEEDIKFCKRAGCNAVVIGALTPSGAVDIDATRRLVRAARPMRVTFHRAIDMARDPVEAVAAVISAGCDKILTSGGAVTAMDGAATIRDMHTAGDGKVDLIAAAGVTEHNAVAMLQATGCAELHGSLRHARDSVMTFRKSGLWMGGVKTNDENTEFVSKSAAPERIARLLQAVQVMIREQ